MKEEKYITTKPETYIDILNRLDSISTHSEVALGILGEDYRSRWRRCLKSRRVVVVGADELRKIESTMSGKIFEQFSFRKMPFEEFTIVFDDPRFGFLWASMFSYDDDDFDNKLMIFGALNEKNNKIGLMPMLMDFEKKCFHYLLPEEYGRMADDDHEFMLLNYCLNQLVATTDVEDEVHKPQLRKQKQGKWEIYHKVVSWTAGRHGKKSEDRHTGVKLRFHTRRGHYRRLKSGKEVWVRECTAGSIKKGMITKEYRMPAEVR